jgi:hypothetical protein
VALILGPTEEEKTIQYSIVKSAVQSMLLGHLQAIALYCFDRAVFGICYQSN